MRYPDNSPVTGEQLAKYGVGTQVVYVPSHIPWEHALTSRFLKYPSGAQPGFIVSEINDDNCYFVRYWRYNHETGLYETSLRTRANSELTPSNLLMLMDTFAQAIVKQWLKSLGYE